MAPSSIKIVHKLVELTEHYGFITHCGYCQHSNARNKKENEGLGKASKDQSVHASQSVIDLAPPTIGSVHFFQPFSTLLVKGPAKC